MDAHKLIEAVERVLFQHEMHWETFLRLGYKHTKRIHRSWVHNRVTHIFNDFVNLVDAYNARDVVRCIHIEAREPVDASTRYLRTLLERLEFEKEYYDASIKLLIALSQSEHFDDIVQSLSRLQETRNANSVRSVVHRECRRLAGTLF